MNTFVRMGGRATLLVCIPCAALFAGTHADWAHYVRESGGPRHAAGAQITPQGISSLARVWTFHTGHLSAPAPAVEQSKFQATPILAEGKLALCTPFNVMIVLDPGSGRELWRYDPKIDLEQKPANDFNCRGVTYWRDPRAAPDAACAARLFMGTNDRRLIAVDLESGLPCDGFGRQGVVAVDPGMALRWPGEFQITSPPVVAGDTVIVGSAISDNARVEAPRGTVRAFDLRTGRLRWTFDPIPRGVAAARVQGWRGAAIPVEGHANVWSAMSVDEVRGLVFLPTSSPSPDFFGGLRPGDNRYANSVVALEAATGAVRWAFQTVHHDVWDYDVPAQPLLATIRKDGRLIDVVIQVTKMGLVFTLDRGTGAPIFAVEERSVPQGGVDGEALSPTQPFPAAPKPLARNQITPEDAFGLTPIDRRVCAERIRKARAEGLYTPPSIQGTILFPFTGGGANWGGAAFDPATNRLFVNVSNALHLVTLIPRKAGVELDPAQYETADEVEFAHMRGAPYAMTRELLLSPLGLPCNPPPWGELHAIDMNDGAIAWTETLGTTEDLAPLGLALGTGTPNLGGPLVTESCSSAPRWTATCALSTPGPAGCSGAAACPAARRRRR